jgi:single-strand DNA-binding protein
MYKNHVELIGFIGNDPELKSSANGRAFARLSIATSERWKDRDGEYQDRTEWHTAFLWGKRAEAAVRILKKGSHVLVEGMLRSREKVNEQTGEVTQLWAIQAESFRNLRPEKVAPAEEPEAAGDPEPSTAGDDIPL